MERKVKELLKEFKEIKQRRKFTTVDTHFHPFDVMGVLSPNSCEYHKAPDIETNFYFKPTLLELLKYDRLAKLGTSISFSFVPKFIKSTISTSYRKFNQKQLLIEMGLAGIDKVCFLPIEPWVTTELIGDKFAPDDYSYILGSVDIHSTDPEQIYPRLQELKRKYNIVGLKLHPNLQGFHPIPEKNESSKTQSVLIEIYQAAEKLGLYLQFHGGSTYYTEETHDEYAEYPRAKHNARLENFLLDSVNGPLGNYDIPIIIAHAASYAVLEVDSKLLLKATSRHRKLYFDTSGVSPRILKKLLETVGPRSVVFGSDGPYNRITFNAAFLLTALREVSGTQSDFEDSVEKVFSTNFFEGILK